MTDVCMILEGTYPYVSGGVSSCVHQLIRATGQIHYGLYYIGDRTPGKKVFKYVLPHNVDYLKEDYLFELQSQGSGLQQKKFVPSHIQLLFFDWVENILNAQIDSFPQVLEHLFSRQDFNAWDLFYTVETWEHLKRFYQGAGEQEGLPFLDFFYNWRNGLIPLFKMLQATVPQAQMYHCLSTGYAGLMGVRCKLVEGRPLMLTEHGIYRHEREVEIGQAQWLWGRPFQAQVESKRDFLKDWWVKIFDYLGKLTYHHSNLVTTLYQGNKLKQISYGAQEGKIKIIPNGMKLDFSLKKAEKNPAQSKVVVALVGRVVPIKDIKTFIKSISLLSKVADEFEVWILGPYEEDPDYYLECKSLVSFLNLDSLIDFKGMVNLKNYYPLIDVLVLSSISEGQPMVILEGFAYGVPCVSTDVGSCRELIMGLSADDQALGAAGAVVDFGRPQDLASAIQGFVIDEKRRQISGEIGRERVRRFYTEEKMTHNYLSSYFQLMNRGAHGGDWIST